MITLFRKIRQKLITENKFSRYLLYAVGEILLVVIGILIALQVNNWDIEEQNRKKEFYYLQSIKTSIDLSQAELNRVITDAEEISSGAEELFQMLVQNESDNYNDRFIDSLLSIAADYSMISLNDGGIREILSTGSLDIIRDERIRIFLASWDERVHKIRKFEEETQYISRNYTSHVNKYRDASLYVTENQSSIIPESKEQLLNSPELFNYLVDIWELHTFMHERYSSEKKALDSLSLLIGQYLSE